MFSNFQHFVNFCTHKACIHAHLGGKTMVKRYSAYLVIQQISHNISFTGLNM